MCSLSLMQQWILQESWSFFICRANEYRAQSLTHGNAFLGSILMIIIVTNLAWEPVSQDLHPWWHSSSISHPDLAWKPFSLAKLVPKLSQDVCLGKGSGGILQTSRSFHLFSTASWEVYNNLLKLVRVGTLSSTCWRLCRKLSQFCLIK